MSYPYFLYPPCGVVDVAPGRFCAGTASIAPSSDACQPGIRRQPNRMQDVAMPQPPAAWARRCPIRTGLMSTGCGQAVAAAIFGSMPGPRFPRYITPASESYAGAVQPT